MKTQPSAPVTAFACFAALLVLIGAYCTARNGAVDEPGFLNPPYMLAHHGHIAFPTYPHNNFFDLPVITHPPVHVMWIGLLWRLGFSVYYAEATPTVLLLLLAIAIILYSPFPEPVKLGWLFSIGFLAASVETITLCFGFGPRARSTPRGSADCCCSRRAASAAGAAAGSAPAPCFSPGPPEPTITPDPPPPE